MKQPITVPIVAIATLMFLILPILVVVPMSFSSASSLSFPPNAFSLRWYRAFFSSDTWLNAMGTSILLACLSSIFAVVLGSLGAYGLRRREIRFSGALESNFMAPMVLPTIIAAVAMYIALGRVGLLGSFIGLVIAHTLLVVPYVIVVMSVAIRAFDLRLEQVAWTMGASGLTTIRRVVIPLLAPNLAAAWIFAFVGSFDEVVVTSFIAGTYDTIPKRMFSELILEISPTITAVATLLIGFTILSLIGASLILRQASRSVAS
ncbi:ABC transporter permease [Mesorhizobium sp. M7A.F.Ca.US.006.01.1.1]|uniref:ABC transporter permease n=1 Tax=Mesorhizobium sp. M7A.F.Ca.US.006.01.1.1 TaxID=2496707 RepID=UPI000FCC502B|nr:ABC transporter permease [Mesorhizobium sp. M7A.F.Ca.US.006.01.1.1]RUZ75997.1 ABC transporter permease [Mesorhizobium sp. M7A.F.Ca.US.006.01.1.1]